MRLSTHIQTRFLLAALPLVWAHNTPAQSSSNIPPTDAAQPVVQARPGIHLQRVAGNNLVESPAAIAFDEQGRLYVAELRDYPTPSSGDSVRGRVRLLEDTDGDGVFDTSTIFADALQRPSAIACSRGGVFVGGEGELVYLRDQDGDGISDLRRTLLNLNAPATKPRLWELPRGMVWGPDCRIYLTLPLPTVSVVNPNASGWPAAQFRSGGISFNPLTMELRAEASPGATGISFDEAGRSYSCSPTTPLAVGILSGTEITRNPFGPKLPSVQSLVAAQSGILPMDCLIYRGNGYSTNMNGCAFLADPAGRNVWMVSLWNGARHPEVTGEGSRFLTPLITASSSSFRPMHLAVGPDDAIYIADFGRSIDPAVATPRTNTTDDLPAPAGRIWRLASDSGFPTAERTRLPEEAIGWVAALGSSNSWTRATAARWLFETQPTNAARALRGVLTHAKWPVARVGALRALSLVGTAPLRELGLEMTSKDEDAKLAAIALATSQIRDGRIPDNLWASLRVLSGDASPEIRRNTALALAAVNYPSPRSLMREIYMSDMGDAWMQRVVLSSVPENHAGMFIEFVGQPRIRNSAEGFALLKVLASSVGLAGRNGEVSDCLRAMLDLDLELESLFPLVTALSDGVQGGGNRLSSVDPDGYWQSIGLGALNVAMGNGSDRLRAEATRVVAACIGPDFVADEYLLLALAPGLPESMQIPAIRALAAQGFERDYEALTQRWHFWGPREQFATLNTLLETDDGADALLRALSDGRIPVNALTSVHINLLRTSHRDDIRARADRLFGRDQPNRDAILTEFLDALDQQGSPSLGSELFTAQCSSCHRMDGEGLAPSPMRMGTESPLHLLAGLLDPSREIATDHSTTILWLKNGRRVWGTTEDTDGPVIHLRTDSGLQRYLSTAVETFGRTEWSLMPDNMAAGLNRQEVSDILAYLKASNGR